MHNGQSTFLCSSPVSLSFFSLAPDLLFDCSRALDYAKIRTVLQSNLVRYITLSISYNCIFGGGGGGVILYISYRYITSKYANPGSSSNHKLNVLNDFAPFANSLYFGVFLFTGVY